MLAKQPAYMEVHVPDDLEDLDIPEQSTVREGARIAPTIKKWLPL